MYKNIKTIITLLLISSICLFSFACTTGSKRNPNECVVTFQSNGNTTYQPVVVQKGTLVARPKDPVKQDSKKEYEFLYWHLDGVDEEWIFEQYMVEKDIVLVAKYKLVASSTEEFLPQD